MAMVSPSEANLRATAEPSRGPTPTTAAMPLEELEPDTDLIIWRERERESNLAEQEPPGYLARQQAARVSSSFELRVVGLDFGHKMACPLGISGAF
jgi:hypothetical protein